MIQPFDAEVAGRANEKLPGNLGNGYLSGANFQPLLVKTSFASLLPIPGYQRDFPCPFPEVAHINIPIIVRLVHSHRIVGSPVRYFWNLLRFKRLSVLPKNTQHCTDVAGSGFELRQSDS